MGGLSGGAPGATGGARFGGIRGQGAGSFIGGEVVSKDATSLTMKLPDGGSRIVFLANSTKVMTTEQSSIDSVTIGRQVSVQGTQNPDGSVTAQSV